MRYKRIFVTLRNPGGLRTNAFGKCILESHGDKAKISISVQNLKPQLLYNACTMIGENQQIIGTIATDKRGRGEIKLNINPSEINLDHVQKIMVVDKSDGISMLEGETENTPENPLPLADTPALKAAEIVGKEPIKDAAVAEHIKEPVKEAAVTEPIKEPAKEPPHSSQRKTPQEKPIKKVDIEKVIGRISEAAEKETQTETPDEVHKATELAEVPVEIAPRRRPNRNNTSKPNNPFEKDEETSFADLNRLFTHNKTIAPFQKQTKSFSWTKISLKETIYLPINFWSLVNDPFIVACYKRHNHLVLGRFQKEYLLGLPDTYNQKNKARANAKGFVQFKCCDDTAPKEGEAGYWIMPIYAV